MTHPLRADAALFQKFLLKIEQRQHLAVNARHELHAAFLPGPDLGGHVADDGDAERDELLGQPQVEAGVVHEDDQVRLEDLDAVEDRAEQAEIFRQVLEDLGETGRVGGPARQEADEPESFHPRAADAVEFQVRPQPAQGREQGRAELVPGRFAGDDQDFLRTKRGSFQLFWN